MTQVNPQATLDSYEVWFLTGSQGLYGEETLRQVEEQSRAVHEQLAPQLQVPDSAQPQLPIVAMLSFVDRFVEVR